MRTRVILVAVAAILAHVAPVRPAMALVVEGVEYPESVTQGGVKLRLVGAGVRTKWMFDVYTMGAYTKSGACAPRVIRSRDEVKYLKLVMLRHVSKAKMAEALGESFARNTPADATEELKQQIATFLSYVYDCPKGAVMEMVYVPGKGTTLKKNGKKHGAVVPGRAFARVLFDIYFSPKTCCTGLQKQVLDSCKR